VESVTMADELEASFAHAGEALPSGGETSTTSQQPVAGRQWAPMPMGETLPAAPSPFHSGVDAAEIPRIAAALERWGERFLRRVYTDAEQLYCRDRPHRLAGRFAAKEAVSKALGTGIRALRWRDIEVLPDQRGRPTVTLHGKAAGRARQMGLTWFSLSITHTGDLAIVFVIAG